MTKLLTTLTLTAAKKPKQVNAVVHRRSKMCVRIAEQIALAQAQQAGTAYAPVKMKLVKDTRTGLKNAVATHKRVKQWWFMADDGAIALTVRYGNKTLELAKGKWAVAVADYDELVKVLHTLRDAVNAGELDQQMDTAAASLRSGFAA